MICIVPTPLNGVGIYPYLNSLVNKTGGIAMSDNNFNTILRQLDSGINPTPPANNSAPKVDLDKLKGSYNASLIKTMDPSEIRFGSSRILLFEAFIYFDNGNIEKYDEVTSYTCKSNCTIIVNKNGDSMIIPHDKIKYIKVNFKKVEGGDSQSCLL